MCACRGCGAGKQLQVSAHGGWRRLAWRGEQASRQTGRLLPHNKLAEGDTVPPAPGIIWPDPGLVRSTHGALRAAGCSLNSQREPAPSHEDGGVRGVVPGASRRAAWPLHTGSRSSFQARAWPLLGVPLCSQHPAFVPLHTGSRSSFQARAWPLLGSPFAASTLLSCSRSVVLLVGSRL